MKKPIGQIFPEWFYAMVLTPFKFWLKRGENKMLKNNGPRLLLPTHKETFNKLS